MLVIERETALLVGSVREAIKNDNVFPFGIPAPTVHEKLPNQNFIKFNLMLKSAKQ